MRRWGNEGELLSLVGPSFSPMTGTKWSDLGSRVSDVEERGAQIHLESLERRIEATGDPADCVRGSERSCDSSKVPHCVQLRCSSPIRVWVLSSLPRSVGLFPSRADLVLRHEFFRDSPGIDHRPAQNAWVGRKKPRELHNMRADAAPLTLQQYSAVN